jgi:hypothetical protein
VEAKKPKRGRIPKITLEIQHQIAGDVRKGVPQAQAAIRAGITERCLCLWMAVGKKAKSGPHFQFFQAIKKARADRLEASVARIEAAAKGGAVVERTSKTEIRTLADGTILTTETVSERTAQPQWTADAWFLERQHPDEFAGNKREVKELREQLAALVKAIGNGQVKTVNPQSQADPGVSGNRAIDSTPIEPIAKSPDSPVEPTPESVE